MFRPQLAFLFSITALGLLCFAAPTKAAVIISEVLPNPAGADYEGEFVEVYNNGSTSEDLGGWTIDDITEGGSSPKTIPNNTIIEPGSYLVLPLSFSRYFNNDSDSVNLIDKTGVLISSASYTGDGSGGQVRENYSWALVNSQWQWVTPPTPGQPNSSADSGQTAPPPEAIPTFQIPSPISQDGEVNYLRGIIINELLPNPVGDDGTLEFIELKNINQYAVDLGSWKLDDAEGGSSPYTIPASTTIPALGFFVFYSEDTHIALNNKGDEARLFLPSGEIVDSVAYPQSEEGVAYARTEFDTWSWTTTPTPGSANIITVLQPPFPATSAQPTASIQLESGSKKSAPAEATAGSQESGAQQGSPAQSTTTKPTTNSQQLVANLPPTSQVPVPTTSTVSTPQLASAQPFPTTNTRPFIDFKSAVLISSALAVATTLIWKKRNLTNSNNIKNIDK